AISSPHGSDQRTPATTAIPANPRRTQPEMMLIRRSQAGVTRLRSILTTLRRTSHQAIEPAKTPAMSRLAEVDPSIVATPNPAKMAAKERMVVGLVRVNAKVEANAVAVAAPGTAAVAEDG